MHAERPTNPFRQTSAITHRAVLLIGAILMAASLSSADSVVSANSVDDWSASAAVCPEVGDVYQLTEPGSYSAFAHSTSGITTVEVRGSHGEILATSDATIAKPIIVDLLTGARFGVVPPPIFDVDESVLIHVQHDGSPYELVVVRTDSDSAWSRLDIHPAVETTSNNRQSCLIGDHAATMKIRTDGAYSDLDHRQVFRVDSPT